MKKLLYILSIVLCGVMFSCSDSDVVTKEVVVGSDDLRIDTTLTLNFAVVTSSVDDLTDETKVDIVEWVEENWNKSVDEMHVKVKLQVQWFNADDTIQNVTLNDYVTRLANTDSIDVVIAPARFSYQEKLAEAMAITKKPLIIPYCVHDDMVREYADDGFLWVLGDANLTQAEVLAQATSNDNCSSVAFLGYKDSYTYGLLDYLGYVLYEKDIVVKSLFSYSDHDSLKKIFRISVGSGAEEIILSLKSVDDVLAVTQEYNDILNEMIETFVHDNPSWEVETAVQEAEAIMPRLLFDNRVTCEGFDDFAEWNITYKMGGIDNVGDPTTGYSSAYRARYGGYPFSTAYFYDAFHLPIYASVCKLLSKKYADLSLNDVIRKLTDAQSVIWKEDGSDGTSQCLSCGWYPGMLEEMLSYNLNNEVNYAVSGASGLLVSQSLPIVGFSTYERWTIYNGRYTTFDTFSRNPNSASYSIDPTGKTKMDNDEQYYETIDAHVQYVSNVENRWAVVVAPVRGYDNYRFVSSAYAFYHFLKDECGYDDRHIIFIADEGVPTSSENFMPNSLFMVDDKSTNYYQGNEEIDYTPKDLTLDDFITLLSGGEVKGETPFQPTQNDDVLVLWFGHGTSDGLAWNASSSYAASEVLDKDKVEYLASQMKNGDGRKYNKMFWFVEGCFSAKPMDGFLDSPGAIIITSADDYEMSRAANPYENAWLANQCTLQLYSLLKQKRNCTFYELYSKLYYNTRGSHPQLMNERCFGKVTRMSAGEFF